MGAGMALGTRRPSNAAVNDRIRNVYMCNEGQLGIQIRFAHFPSVILFRSLGRPEHRKIAQRRRDIVVIRVTDLNAGILRCILRQGRPPKARRCSKEENRIEFVG